MDQEFLKRMRIKQIEKMKAIADEVKRIKKEKQDKIQRAQDEERKEHLISKDIKQVIGMIDKKIEERREFVNNMIRKDMMEGFLSEFD